jgi:hypothetical protein
MDTKQFIKEVNEKRKDGKAWYWFVGAVNNKKVRIKAYNTWLQVYEVDGVILPCPHGLKVREFKELLRRGVEE